MVTTSADDTADPDHDATEEAEAEEPEVDHHHGAEEAEAEAQEADDHDDRAEEAEAAKPKPPKSADHGPPAERAESRPASARATRRSVGDDHLVGVVGATREAPVLDVAGPFALGPRRRHRSGRRRSGGGRRDRRPRRRSCRKPRAPHDPTGARVWSLRLGDAPDSLGWVISGTPGYICRTVGSRTELDRIEGDSRELDRDACRTPAGDRAGDPRPQGP